MITKKIEIPANLFTNLSKIGIKLKSPIQLKIKKIKPQLACEMNRKWHSRLPIIHWSNIVRNTYYICYGVEYDGRRYAVGIWSSPVAQNRFKEGKQMLELRRVAICNDAPKNTASRIISLMIKDIKKRFPKIKRLISYQDAKIHLGTIYKASNWKIQGKTKGISWTTKNRQRNKEQTKTDKIRWEYII